MGSQTGIPDAPGAEMNPRRILIASLVLAGALSPPLDVPARAQTPARCEAREPGAVPIFSPAVLDRVTGQGRLQFYSAPDFHCPIAGLFVVPKDELIEYARTDDGWSSVMYIGDGASSDQGWVRSARLKLVGTVGPKQ